MKIEINIDKRHAYILGTLLVVLCVISGIQVITASPAVPNPGHPASEIEPGTFASGSYTFPQGLEIKGSTAYINWYAPSGQPVKIGYNSPVTMDGTVTIDHGLKVSEYINVPAVGTRSGSKLGYVLGDLLLGSCSERGKMYINKNTQCNRDSLCYCGYYDGSLQWICLISC